MLNPPSIPSHLSVFGYEENQHGQLIKQQSNQVGFAGTLRDKVGPGDYEIGNAKNVINKTVTGCVAWQKPDRDENVSPSKKQTLPGPGDYEVSMHNPQKQASSMFISKVQRSGTSMTNRNKLQQQNTTARTGTQMGSRYQATSNKLLSQG